jgi:hypothetical protein
VDESLSPLHIRLSEHPTPHQSPFVG